MAKRKAQTVSDAEDDLDYADSQERYQSPVRSKRQRQPSKKQAQLDVDHQTTLERKYKDMEKKYQKKLQRLEALVSKHAANDKEPLDGSSPGPESEEEAENVVEERRHKSVFESRGIFTASEKRPLKHLRRHGDPLTPTASVVPDDATQSSSAAPSRSRTPSVSIPMLEGIDKRRPHTQSPGPAPSEVPDAEQARSQSSPPPVSHRHYAVPHGHHGAPSETEHYRTRSPSLSLLQPPLRHTSSPTRSTSSPPRRVSSSLNRRNHSPSPPRHDGRPFYRHRDEWSSYGHDEQSHAHRERSHPDVSRHLIRSAQHPPHNDSQIHRGRSGDSDRNIRSRKSPPHVQSSSIRHAHRRTRSPRGNPLHYQSPSRSPGPRGRPGSRPTQTVPASAPVTTLTDPPFLNGCAPTGKPKAGDYENRINKMIVLACHRYGILIATDTPFPDTDQQDSWAARAWAEACAGAQVAYRCTDRIQKIITGRGSHARGTLRDKIRPLIPSTYGFATDGSERAKAKNIARYAYLLDRDAPAPEPVFHYKDVETRHGFAHNQIVISAINDEWFADPTGPGIKYMAEFSPIREVTLALVFTTIEFCLDQWADGTLNKNLVFSEKLYKPKYENYLMQVQQWCATDLDASRIVRQRMYDRARRASGAAPPTLPAVGLTAASRDRLRLELAAQAAAGDDNENA